MGENSRIALRFVTAGVTAFGIVAVSLCWGVRMDSAVIIHVGYLVIDLLLIVLLPLGILSLPVLGLVEAIHLLRRPQDAGSLLGLCFAFLNTTVLWLVLIGMWIATFQIACLLAWM